MSLNKRIIISATIVLVIFITLTAAALDRAFKNSLEIGLRDNLTSQLYALMATAEIEDNSIVMPSDELDSLLGLPSSGVYAYITDSKDNILWKSSSTLDVTTPLPVAMSSGQRQLIKSTKLNEEYYTLAYGVDWSTDAANLALTFNVITDLKSFYKQLSEYRKTLWSWLLAMAILLLLSQAFILRWGLKPLRKVNTELNNIEAGKQEKIENDYPREIEKLTDNINILLQQERDQKIRYRHTLGDLAHSMKTPLAVLQSGLGTENKDTQEQISRMNDIVEYQLQRAATAGKIGMGKTISVKPVVERIISSLQKVYHDKNIVLNLKIKDNVLFKGDEGDLMELLGNLFDNAYKWAKGEIIITATNPSNQKLNLTISDDGPGFDANEVEKLQQRGMRADQHSKGHGIGLSIVNNIINTYKGKISISKSSLGGAEIKIVL